MLIIQWIIIQWTGCRSIIKYAITFIILISTVLVFHESSLPIYVIPSLANSTINSFQLVNSVAWEDDIRGIDAFNLTASQKLRLVSLQDECERYDIKNRITNRLIVEYRSQTVYCSIPKVATTSIKRLLLVASGLISARDLEYEADKASKNSMYNNRYRLLNNGEFPSIIVLTFHRNKPELNATYAKFMFVRNPYDRLLSAYRDKFDGAVEHTYFIQIYYAWKGEKEPKAKQLLSPPTFAQFLEYIIEQNEEDPELLDIHWMPYHLLCLPCQIRYDLIGKLETMRSDMTTLSSRFKYGQTALEYLYQEQPGNLHRTSLRDQKTTEDYYKEVPDDILRGINEIYRPDFELFNYTIINKW